MLRRYRNTCTPIPEWQLKEIKAGRTGWEAMPGISCHTSADCPQPSCYELNGGYYCYNRLCRFGYC